MEGAILKMTRTMCVKCGYKSTENRKKFQSNICSICFRFAPNEIGKFQNYLKEKVDWFVLETFRKHSQVGNPQKKGMIQKSSAGNPMSRAPLGYKMQNKKLIPAENSEEVEEIFEHFLNNKISLNKLSKKYNLSVNGLKKVLTNFTYIGKIKFNNHIYQGEHRELISPRLFNLVQNKLENLGIKRF